MFLHKRFTTIDMSFINSAHITEPKTEIKTIADYHYKKTGSDVNEIEFHNSVVFYFPRKLRRIFSGLTHMTIYKCGLKNIS